MNIRKMKSEDYEKTYALWLSCPGMGMNSLDDSRAGTTKFLERNPDTCFVAEERNEILGENGVCCPSRSPLQKLCSQRIRPNRDINHSTHSQKDRNHPGNRENHKKAFQCVIMPEYCKNPYNTQDTGPQDRQHCRQRGMSHPSEKTCRDLIKTADWLPDEDQKNTDTGGINNCLFRRKNPGSSMTPDSKWNCDHRTEKYREKDTDSKDLSASFLLTGCKVLTGKSSGCLTKGSDHIISEIFKIHGNGAACCSYSTETVDRCLNKDIGKAEDCSLYCCRNSGSQVCSNGDTCHSKPAYHNQKQIQKNVDHTENSKCEKRTSAVSFGTENG